MSEMTLGQFVAGCVEERRARAAAELKGLEDRMQAAQEAWVMLLVEVRERLPEPLRAAAAVPAWALESSREPGIDAYVMVGLGEHANLKVYAHPGELRYPEREDYYTRVPHFEVGRDLRWEMWDEGEGGLLYGWWDPFTTLNEAVAAAYEELQRPTLEKPVVDSSASQDERPGLFEICPLLMATQPGSALLEYSVCIKEKCGWWVWDRCGVATLAMGGRE